MKYCNAIMLMLGILGSCNEGDQIDLVIRNGNIYTVDPDQPLVEAVAVRSGIIVAAGSDQQVGSLIDERTEILDLNGRTMTPGFIDAHAHLMGIGISRLNLDLSSTKSYQEIIDMVKDAVGASEQGQWIIGRGWHQDKWTDLPESTVRGFPIHNRLSQVSPENPVFLKHASGHAGIGNAKAMELAHVTAQSQISGDGEGAIIKDENGLPTGIFTESAQALISTRIPDNSTEKRVKALELAIDHCLSNGITSFQDAGSGQKDIDLYQAFLEEGKLKIRLWVMLNGSDKDLLQKWYNKGPKIGLGNQHLSIGAIKLYADGALGSRGAWLLEPYGDLEGHYGNQIMELNEIYEIASKSLETGFQVCTHAIGDRANREVLNQYERAFRSNHDAATRHRFRIEHAQHLHPDDIPRFAELRVIASMQAIHMSSDRPWAIQRLDSQRIANGAYAWKSLIASGAKIINGTDAPVEPLNPIECFYSSVSRKTLDKIPIGGYEPSQKMSRQQALESYTIGPAYGAKEEAIKGSIQTGKVADFTIFSLDIMKVHEDEILDAQIDYTIIGGKILYQRRGGP